MEQEVVESGGGHLFGMSFGTFLLDMMFIFFFVIWFWILIRVMMDLFRRKDISGGAKVLWVIFLVILPYIGVLAYLLTQGDGMAQRVSADANEGQQLGVTGTPSFLINGKPLVGAQPYEAFVEAIEAAIAAQPPKP